MNRFEKPDRYVIRRKLTFRSGRPLGVKDTRPRKNSPKWFEQALELRLAGHTYQEIGERLHISRQRVQQGLSPSREIRQLVVERAKEHCEQCGLFLGLMRGDVHHKRFKEIHPTVYCDSTNLQYVCMTCHRRLHTNSPN